MSLIAISSLADAAEARRRELPVGLALCILMGGLGAAIVNAPAPVLWAAIMALLLIADAKLYRRLDIAEPAPSHRLELRLGAWAFLNAAVFSILPTALWLHGEAAGAAAAMALWIACVVRHFGRGFATAWTVALMGAAPPILCLVWTPILATAFSAAPNWDLAVIAVAGGVALIAYIIHARGAERGAVLVQPHDELLTEVADARREAVETDERLRVALAAGRSVVWEADLKTETLHWFGDPTPIYGRVLNYAEFNASLLGHDDEHRAHILRSFDQLVRGELESFEHKLVREDGEARWLQIYARGYPGRSGNTRRIICLTKDVTARKRDEERFLMAMTRAEEALRAKRSLLMEAGAQAPAAPRLRARATGGVARVDVEQMFERLEHLLDEMHARDALMAQTLESLRVTRELAESASVSKSNFLANMSHELRTPLNAIIGYSEMLHEEAEADGRDSDMADIQRVLSSARQLLHLINGILDLSKIEAGRMEVAPNDFDAARLIEEAVATVRPSAEKNGNVLSLDVEGALGAAHTDSFKLNQCLLNLLSNAAKFTKSGRITVRASRETRDGKDWLSIAVSDTGVGLSEDQIARLFNAFMQGEASTSNVYGGTGLGLAITRKIMQLLGGDISVESAPGTGSTFTLTCPTHANAAVYGERKSGAPFAADGGQRLVLVVDDEASARDLTERALGRLGFAVVTAASGAEGLALARARQPSLIVLDINLPDMTGWDVLASLAQECGDVPVLVHSVDDNRARARSAGACELLVKPADRDVLAAAVLRFARAPELPAPALPASTTTFAKSA